MCILAFSFVAYNIDLDTTERVKIYHCEKRIGSKIVEYVKTEPTGRECGFQIIESEQYWWCFINKRNNKEK